MRVYKSLYEAVKVGVTNDGYTPVTRMLFFPVFDPKGDIQPCDENGVPYAVDTKNANAWCKGEDNIPVNIKTAVGKKSTLESLIKYYKSKAFTDNLYEATEDEMYEAVVALVKDCEDVSDTAKKALLKVILRTKTITKILMMRTKMNLFILRRIPNKKIRTMRIIVNI